MITKTSVGESVAQIAAYNGGRNWFVVCNHGESDVYIAFCSGGEAVTAPAGTAPGIKVAAGTHEGLGLPNAVDVGQRLAVKQAIYAICAAGETTDVVVHEG